MSFTIAVAGKGGTGKTTLSALVVRLLKEQGRGSILAIDADPNSNLGEVLGLTPSVTIGGILDDIASHPDKIPAGIPKERFIEYQVQTAVIEADGFDLLTMGRPEGPGCYCYVNNVLRNIEGKLAKEYDYIIIDNEAGLEHLSRRTTRAADVLLLVTDPTRVGFRAVKRMNELTKELDLKIAQRYVVVNRLNGAFDEDALRDVGVPLVGTVSLDNVLLDASVSGESIFHINAESAALKAVRTLGESIWR
ncbi:MAG TPA: AAA family ATPase [Candidatus Omnitrophota bacterium]|nr:AAA family ATPase [Candidatus Omnitrophota bacterium]HNX81975.1 AAA family ATPase [Candidatus Omnitrophota bacterium]